MGRGREEGVKGRGRRERREGVGRGWEGSGRERSEREGGEGHGALIVLPRIPLTCSDRIRRTFCSFSAWRLLLQM